MNFVEQFEPHLVPAMLVMFRIGGVMSFGPVFGSPVVPPRVKVFLTVIVGLSVYPILSAELTISGGPMPHLWMLVPLAVMEVTFGAVIGFLASMPLVAAQTSGLIMGQQMGLGFARFYNPGIDDEADIIGQLLFLLALAGFLAIGGHEAMLFAVLKSFEHLPLGGFTPDGTLLTLIAGLLLSAFELALRIAAPLLALIFLETIAMGFIAKTVPQLNILSLGFPIRILAGILIVAVGLVVIDQVLMEGVDDLLHAMFLWIESLDTIPE